jgi:catechol 2,3-dioxygenase-like lactoylglutathione lyase family enzyme
MKVMRLGCVMIYVKDFPKMKDLYSEMLGSQPINREWTDTWAEFDAGGARFALHAIPAEIAQGIEVSSPPKPRERNPIKLVFRVEDVRAERARLESLGITMLNRQWQNPDESCEGIDPEGNVFQISSV